MTPSNTTEQLKASRAAYYEEGTWQRSQFLSWPMSTQYSEDFSAWTRQTVQLLREHRWQDIDVPKLIDEVEDLGKSERRAIVSQLTRLLLHLLKWQFQSQRRSDSWLDSITDTRTQIDLTIEDSPSLKHYPAEKLEESYQRACRQAAKQTHLAISTFPQTCPYSPEQVLAENWLPQSEDDLKKEI